MTSNPGIKANAEDNTRAAERPNPEKSEALTDRPSSGRRQEIISLAGRSFILHEYRGVSIRQISRNIGVSHPAVFHYFKSKEAILDAVIDDLENHVRDIMGDVQPSTITREGFTERYVSEIANSYNRAIIFVGVLSTEAVDPGFPRRLRVIRLRRVCEHLLEHVMSGLKARNLIAPELDTNSAARTLINSVTSSTIDDAGTYGTNRGISTHSFRDIKRLTELVCQ